MYAFVLFTGELADDTREVLELVSTASPLTKQKTVRCFKENIKMDDGKNFEIEHIKKKVSLELIPAQKITISHY